MLSRYFLMRWCHSGRASGVMRCKLKPGPTISVISGARFILRNLLNVERLMSSTMQNPSIESDRSLIGRLGVSSFSRLAECCWSSLIGAKPLVSAKGCCPWYRVGAQASIKARSYAGGGQRPWDAAIS